MTKTKFYCEKGVSNLIIQPQKEKLISIAVENPEYCSVSGVPSIEYIYLTIKDAELLMDEIHRAIIKLEGGENE